MGWLVRAAILLLLLPSATATWAENKVDLELVLAVDVSMSMDADEAGLQRRGYVEAFSSPEIVAAMLQSGTGRVALTYVEWAGERHAHVVVPWMLIASPDDARRFVELLKAGHPTRVDRTSISAALTVAGSLFDGNGFEGERKVIDISGDGPNNQGDPLPNIRDELVDRGVVINGLALMVNPGSQQLGIDNLDEYYRECVAGGFGSFVLPVREWKLFAGALRLKLFQEITGIAPVVRPPLHRAAFSATDKGSFDCEVGEKIWLNFQKRFGIRDPR